jgi:hypothetical protein
MLFQNILKWVVTNRWKTILFTALLSGSGYLAYNDAARNNMRMSLSAAFDPYPEYHVYMDSCSFQPGNTNNANSLDTLSIGLRLCNAAPTTLASAGVKIDSSTIKICSADSVKFIVMRQQDELGEWATMDTLVYGDVLANTCNLPMVMDPKLGFFKFCAGMMAYVQTDSVCVHFTAKIYYGANKPPVPREMRIRVPVKSAPISLAENKTTP